MNLFLFARQHPFTILFSTFLFFSFSHSDLRAQGRFEKVVETGDSAASDGKHASFSEIRLNNSGQLAYRSFGMTGTSAGAANDSGLFRYEGFGFSQQITRKGDATANGAMGNVFNVRLNDSGQIAFLTTNMTGTVGGSLDNEAIFKSAGAGLVEVARENDLTSNGRHDVLGLVRLNAAGQVGFSSFLRETTDGVSDNNAIFLHTSNTQELARRGNFTNNGRLGRLNEIELNDFGQVAFSSFPMTETMAGAADDEAAFLSTGFLNREFAREGDLTSNGTLGTIQQIHVNNPGQIVFNSSGIDAASPADADRGIFLADGDGLSEVVRRGDTTANGEIDAIIIHGFNDAGQVAFQSFDMTNTSQGIHDNQAIFFYDGINNNEYIREGDLTSNGLIRSFSSIESNESIQVAFLSELSDSFGGPSDNESAFITDGVDLVEVLRKGDNLSGNVITDILSVRLNDFGQVAVHAAHSAGESVELFTPDLHWRNVSANSWDDHRNWTLSINPGMVHNVFIDPEASLVVHGPTSDVEVRSLTLGGGSGVATLDLREGASLTSLTGMTIKNKGILTGDGIVFSDLVVESGGTIVADNLTFQGGLITNGGIIRGNGLLTAPIINKVSGQIRANGGDVLQLAGVSQIGGLINEGRIEVLGGEFEVMGEINNINGTGLIVGRDGVMRWEKLNNDGSLGISFGITDVFGDIDNNASGTINISGGANVTLYDDLVQNGSLQVVSVGGVASNLVVFGELSGTGGFTGGGNVFAMGDLRPGASPASVLFDGNLFLGAASETHIELGGLGLGEFDQMVVTGDLSLAGQLFVSLIDSHELGAGEQYLIGDVNGLLDGQFLGLGEGDLVGSFSGFDLFISYAGGDGNDVVLFSINSVPEPASFVLIGLVGLCLMIRRRSEHIV